MKQKHWITTLGIGLLSLVATAAPLTAKSAANSQQDKPEESAPLILDTKTLRQLDREIILLAENASPATVSLVSIGGHGAGSGVVVSPEGLILTAGHVLAAMSDEIIVMFPDGRRAKAKPLGADFDRDAGMVRITEPGEYPYVRMADSKPLLLNEWCVALGHPGGFDPMRTPPLRLGRVIRNGGFLITDCAVVGGDSGGPLFDTDGRVVGIHSNIGMSLSQNRHVPIAVYHDKWNDLLAGKRTGTRFASVPGQAKKKIDPDRLVLGVKFEKESKKGIVIGEVMKNSPAAKAGLKSGDVIFKAAGKKITTFDQFQKAIGDRKADSKIPLKFRRDGKAKRVKVTLVRHGDLAGVKKQPKTKGKDAKKPTEKPEAKSSKKTEPKIESKPESKAKPKSKKSSSDAELDAYLDKMFKDAKPNSELKLELTPEKIEKFGGMKHFQERLQAKLKQLDPKLLKGRLSGIPSAGPDDFFLSSLKALEPVTKKSAGSTVTVLADGEPVTLGTVVDNRGHILTKDTETSEGTVSMLIGKDKRPATLIRRFPAYDLALFKTSPAGLRPVRWFKAPKGAPLGSLLTAPDPDAKPLGIGVLSVKTRSLGNIGFLGVQSGETEKGTQDDKAEKGVLVVEVVKDSPAAKAGLKKGDVIITIDGKSVANGIELAEAIRGNKVDQTIAVGYLRDGKKRTAKAKLVSRPVRAMPERLRKMNQKSGPMSEKQGGFPKALQHDIPLKPTQCGGPLLDLEGRCIGVNVSRAGRVKTYAIPASEIGKLLAQADKAPAQAKNKPANQAPPKNVQGISEVRKSIEQIRRSIDQIDQRLKQLEDR